jgi:aryl-alcohol dehydrogenase-like predicted oxidoreductase
METSDHPLRRPFGNTGLDIFPLGFGAAPIGFLETDQLSTDRIVGELAAHGVNAIDTAAAYEGSEEALGKALRGRRDKFILISKCGQAFPDLPGSEWSAEVITATIDRSLKRLQTDRLEVMLLHSCGLDVLQNGEALDALIQARDAGKVRFIGYSGDNAEAVYAASVPEFAVIETSINLCDQANIDAVLPLARGQSLGVIAKRPLANTAWREQHSLTGMYQDYAKPYIDRFKAMALEPDPEITWAELALRFAVFQPGVSVGIVGTTRPERVKTNVEAIARGPLPDALVATLRSAFQRASGAADTPWTGLT